jgi:hypothetical protein
MPSKMNVTPQIDCHQRDRQHSAREPLVGALLCRIYQSAMARKKSWIFPPTQNEHGMNEDIL